MLPDTLRKRLQKLGATITPVDERTTAVHVPGADSDYHFYAGGEESRDEEGNVYITPASVYRLHRNPTQPERVEVFTPTRAYNRLLVGLGVNRQHDINDIADYVSQSGPWVFEHPAGAGRFLSVSQELTPTGEFRHRVCLGNRETGEFQAYDSQPGGRDLQLHPDVTHVLQKTTAFEPDHNDMLFDMMEDLHETPRHYARAYALTR